MSRVTPLVKGPPCAVILLRLLWHDQGVGKIGGTINHHKSWFQFIHISINPPIDGLKGGLMDRGIDLFSSHTLKKSLPI